MVLKIILIRDTNVMEMKYRRNTLQFYLCFFVHSSLIVLEIWITTYRSCPCLTRHERMRIDRLKKFNMLVRVQELNLTRRYSLIPKIKKNNFFVNIKYNICKNIEFFFNYIILNTNILFILFFIKIINL